MNGSTTKDPWPTPNFGTKAMFGSLEGEETREEESREKLLFFTLF